MKNKPVEDDFSEEEDSFSLEFVDEDEFNSQQQETQKQPSPPSNVSDEKLANEVSTEPSLSNDEIEKHTEEQRTKGKSNKRKSNKRKSNNKKYVKVFVVAYYFHVENETIYSSLM